MLIFGHKVFAPEELAALGSAFDEAWGEVEGTSGADVGPQPTQGRASQASWSGWPS